MRFIFHGYQQARLRCLQIIVLNLPTLKDHRVMNAFPILLGVFLFDIIYLNN